MIRRSDDRKDFFSSDIRALHAGMRNKEFRDLLLSCIQIEQAEISFFSRQKPDAIFINAEAVPRITICGMTCRKHSRPFRGSILIPAVFLRPIFGIHDQERSPHRIAGLLVSRDDDMIRIQEYRGTVIQQIFFLRQQHFASIRIHSGQSSLLLLPASVRIRIAEHIGTIRRKHRLLIIFSGMSQKRNRPALKVCRSDFRLMTVRNAMRLIEFIHDLFDLNRRSCSLFSKHFPFFPGNRLQQICFRFLREGDSFK